MKLDIDVSGQDILSKDYVICVANGDIIKGFKFEEKLVKILSSRYGQEFYRYKKSKKGKSNFKIRLYCIVVYYLIESLGIKGDLILNICRDFGGREEDIRKSLENFFRKEFDLKKEIYFCKLSDNSNAHKYSFLMRHDKKNKLPTYIKIKLEDFEKWLK